jgi:hypothetical protein
MRSLKASARFCFGLAVLLGATAPAVSGVHLWRVTEAFSSADGTVQFIEIATCCGSTAENCLSCGRLSSNGNLFNSFTNVSGSTLNKRVLIATSAFAALPGAPTPDFIIPANFFSVAGDTLAFDVYDSWVIGAGQLPTDGTTSLNKDPDDTTDTPFTALNSPTNYAGVTGSVNASSGPPAVPDGTGATTPMTVSSPVPNGSSLSVSFDAASCSGGTQHHILYGQRSGFPATPGGTFTLLGSVCAIGNTSPYSWTPVPAPVDGSNLLWFLLAVTDSGGIEGSWGKDRAGNERNGMGNNGSSGSCALVKSVTNACGHP